MGGKWLWLAAGLGLFAILMLPVVLAGGYYAYFQISQRIVPGVFVGASDLSGSTVEQAAVEIQKNWNLEQRITLTDGITAWQIQPSEIGLGVDPLSTAMDAYAVAHGQSLAAEISQMIHSMSKGWGIAPRVHLDPEAARQGLQRFSEEASLAPVDASLRIEGGKAIPVQGEVGYTVNIDETLAQLSADPRAIMLGGYFHVTLMPVSPRVEDVSDAVAEAESLMQSTARIILYDPITNERSEKMVASQDIARWVVVQPGENGPEVSLDQRKAGEYLEALGHSLGSGRYVDAGSHAAELIRAVRRGTPVTMRVRHAPTIYTVKPGDTLLKIGWNSGIPFWMILNANPGLDPDKLLAGQTLNIPSKDDLLPLPVVENKRMVISISKQRLFVYQDGELRSKHVISTGIDRSPTQPGVFQVQTRDKEAYASVWDLYMPNFIGIYEAWPGFMNGLHGLPTLSNGRRLWANILGRPASYGCIILDLETAEWLYTWAEDGVVVEIEP